MDPFEKLLAQLVERMTQAWQLEENRESPLGELAAEAAAVLHFYRGQGASLRPQVGRRAIEPHWSDPWKREYGDG